MKRSFLLALFCLASPCAYADVATGLVGWWQLNVGVGTVLPDSSGNANTMLTHNAPTWVAGQIGTYALNFASASNMYAESPTATSIPKINASQTLSAWINIPNTAATYDIVVPELNGSGANQLRINGGNLQVSQWGGGTTITGGAVSINTWHMVTWTYNSVGPLNTLYIDGTQSGATTATATQNFTPTTVFLGAYGTGAGNENFNGKMDDVRIYNRVLTLQDIDQLYDYYRGKSGMFTEADN